ncbi:2,3-bisphosphoglycerate-independent phosphoglycerate mutase, partial [Tanacetum coccineum]
LLLKGVSGLYVLTNGPNVLKGSSVGYAETLEKDLANLCSKGIDANVASGGRRMYVVHPKKSKYAL